MTGVRARALALPALVLALVWAVALFHGPTSDVHINDLNIYRGYADALQAGRAPYADFALEYPPLALVPMWLAGTTSAGLRLLRDQLCDPDAAGRAGGDGADGGAWRASAPLTAAWIVALSPLLTGAVVRTHFDLVPVALLLAALLALTRARPTAGFALLGVGAMTKLFPALLVPVAAAWLLAAGRGSDALRGAVVFTAVVVAVSLPFLGGGYADAFRFQLDRPVQIESTPASVLFAAGGSRVTGGPSVPDAYKSNGLVGGAADGVQTGFAVVLVGVLALVVALVLRSPPARTRCCWARSPRCSRSSPWGRCSRRSSSSGWCRSRRSPGRAASGC